MKDKLISFKIEPEAKEAFDAICKEFHTTPSQQLRLFVHKTIKDTPRLTFKGQSKENPTHRIT